MGLASKLKLFWLVNLLPWPLNGVTYHPCHGHPSCQTLACYTFPFSTYGQARDRQTDGQTDRRRPSTLNAPTLWGHNAPVIQRRHLAKCSNFIDKIRNYLEARQLAVIVYSSVVLSFKFMHMEFWSSYFGFALPHCLHNLRTHSFVLRIFWWGVLICLRWQSSNKIAYQSPIIFEECLVNVHRRSTPFVFYAVMVCAKLVCELYFKVSLWPSCCMLHQLGVDSRLLRTVSELTHFSAAASDGVSVARTHPRSRYCWRTVINSCFARSWTIRNTFYTVCYRHPHQLHNTTNFNSGHTTENCQTILAA